MTRWLVTSVNNVFLFFSVEIHGTQIYRLIFMSVWTCSLEIGKIFHHTCAPAHTHTHTQTHIETRRYIFWRFLFWSKYCTWNTANRHVPLKEVAFRAIKFHLNFCVIDVNDANIVFCLCFQFYFKYLDSKYLQHDPVLYEIQRHVCRIGSHLKHVVLNIYIYIYVYLSQAIAEIKHFRKCLVISGNALSFLNCLGNCIHFKT